MENNKERGKLRSMVKNRERGKLFKHYTIKFSAISNYEIVKSASGNHLIKISSGEIIGRFPSCFEAMVYGVTFNEEIKNG